MGAVVAGEDEESVVFEVELVKQGHHLPDGGVEAGDHGGFIFFLLGPVFVGVGRVAGDFHAGLFAFVVGVGEG